LWNHDFVNDRMRARNARAERRRPPCGYYVAKDYRVLLMLGDNFGDFSGAYRGSEAEQLKAFEDNKEKIAKRECPPNGHFFIFLPCMSLAESGMHVSRTAPVSPQQRDQRCAV
jgi:predicted secreted acid phosphatase